MYVKINEASIKRVPRQLNTEWRDVLRIIMIEETVRKHEDRTSKLISEQRSIKWSEPFRGSDATFGSHIIILYFTQWLFIIWLLFNVIRKRWRSYLLFVRQRCSINLLWNWSRRNGRCPSHLFPPCVSLPISPKKKCKINYCQRSGCDPLICVLFVRDSYIIYRYYICKGLADHDSTILY